MWAAHCGARPLTSKESPQSKPRASVRAGFLYVDKCLVRKADSRIVLVREAGTVPVPVETFNVLLLGPGTSVTHGAMTTLTNAGTSITWVGDGAGVWYASGNPLTRSNKMLIHQAAIVSDPHQRLKAAQRLYRLRFRDENITLPDKIGDMQLMEAVRMKDVYREHAARTGVSWKGRDRSARADPVNAVMSLAHSCLYAVCHSVIAALGFSTGLGVVHEGNFRAFTLDIADLYKEPITIPAAFDLAAKWPMAQVPASKVRERVRDDMLSLRFIRAVTRDVFHVLGMPRDTRVAGFADANDWWCP